TTLPGIAAAVRSEPKVSAESHLGLQVGSGDEGETACLLFCPLPAPGECSAEARWRVLGRVLEHSCFRRLRSEFEPGYAVFSRFTCVAGQGGMLFAVQSPTASAVEILGHIESFLEDFALQLNSQAAQVEEAARELSMRHVATNDLRAYAEQTLQSWLAGHDAGHQTRVAQAMATLEIAQVLTALEALRHGSGG